MTQKILITGFEPFAGNSTNPSMDLLSQIEETEFLSKLLLPVTFKASWKELETRIMEYSPDWVISFGVAANRKTIDLEKVALNLKEASIADNDGYLAEGEKILNEGQPCFISELPLKVWKSELSEKYPVGVSLSAGSYVCNFVYYNLQHHSLKYNYRSLFVHIPYTDDTLTLDLISQFFNDLRQKINAHN